MSIQILADMAELESRLISERVKAAVRSIEARGVVPIFATDDDGVEKLPDCRRCGGRRVSQVVVMGARHHN